MNTRKMRPKTRDFETLRDYLSSDWRCVLVCVQKGFYVPFWIHKFQMNWMVLVIYSISLSVCLFIGEWSEYLLHRLFSCFALCWSTMSSLINNGFSFFVFISRTQINRVFCVYSFISYDSDLIFRSFEKDLPPLALQNGYLIL